MSENRVEVLISGFPGSSPSNGGMGWSSVGLVRSGDRVILIDTGPFGVRALLRRRLSEHGIDPASVTDLILTHCHHDHSVNWPMLPNARIYLSRAELEWAVTVPEGAPSVPEFYVRELSANPATVLLDDVDEPLTGITTEVLPGHTPGSLVVSVGHESGRTLFLGDAAKSLAELASRKAETTLDAASSASSIEQIWRRWQENPHTVVVPGHDLPLVLDGDGCRYAAERTAQVRARLGTDFEALTTFDLVAGRDDDS